MELFRALLRKKQSCRQEMRVPKARQAELGGSWRGHEGHGRAMEEEDRKI